MKHVAVGKRGVPYVVTHDGRTIRYPDPLVKTNDTVKVDLESNKVVDFYKFDVGNICYTTGGNNQGRIGEIQHFEHHPGSYDIVHIKDRNGSGWTTRLENIFVIGTGSQSAVSLPKGRGIRLTIAEEQKKRFEGKK